MPAVAELVATPSTTAAPMAPTPPTPPMPPVESAKTVTVANRSSFTFQLVGYDLAGEQDELPATGTLVLPGEHVQLTVAPEAGRPRLVFAHFDVIAPHGGVLATGYSVAVSPTRASAAERVAFAPELLTRAVSPIFLVVADA